MKICPKCAEEVQDAARVFKHCGHEFGFKFPQIGCGSMLLLAIGAGLVATQCSPTSAPQYSGTPAPVFNPQTSPSRLTRLVKPYLRDPDSAKVTVVGSGCAYVNSRNGFGGMSGDKRFIVYEDDAVLLEQTSPRKFRREWAKRC